MIASASRLTRSGTSVGLATIGLAVIPGVVAAHDPPDNRFAAPIPLDLLLLGAAAIVALTAVVLAVAGPRDGQAAAPRNAGATASRGGRSGTDGDAPPTDQGTGRTIARLSAETSRRLALALRAGFLLAAAVAVVAGLVGGQDAARNTATVLFWPVWLKGLAIVALLVGSPWRVLSPWGTLSRLLARGTTAGRLGTYPARLGAWPAVAGFVVVAGLVENASDLPASPRATALLVAGYATVMVAGALAVGPGWLRHADFFAVLYRLFGRVAPVVVRRRDDGSTTVRLRPPWRGATAPVADLALVAFVVATVYTVSFDGFVETLQYEYLLVTVGVLAGAGGGVAVITYLAGLGGFIGGFVAVVAVSDRLAGGRPDADREQQPPTADARSDGGAAGRTGGDPAGGSAVRAAGDRLRAALVAFAPTVLPIAAAYELAHNYPYVLQNVGVLLGAGDPLGWLSLPAFWVSQVVLITAGHVVAVVAAHVVTRRRYGATSWRGHLPMTLLMMGYTVLSLWIVSLPVIQ